MPGKHSGTKQTKITVRPQTSVASEAATWYFTKKRSFGCHMTHPFNYNSLLPERGHVSQPTPPEVSSYRPVVFASVLAVIPLTMPMINMTAGTNCPTTTSAKKPRKIQTNNPSFSAAAVAAANAVAGAIVPIMVANVFMTFSFPFIHLPSVLNKASSVPKGCLQPLELFNSIILYG